MSVPAVSSFVALPTHLTHHDLTVLFLALAVLLAVARGMGELARRLHQPAVLGEILAGILLGPTLFGAIAPGAAAFLFPQDGPVPLIMHGLSTLAIALFLLVAGMEVDLSTVWRQGRAAFTVGLFGLLVPFLVGLVPAWLNPGLFGAEPAAAGPGGTPTLAFILFFATAMSISALPVIAKILMDLDLYRTTLGMTIVAAAIFNDLVGWIVFALILALMGHTMGGTGGAGGPGSSFSVPQTILATLVFAVLMLSLGRFLINRALPWLQAHTSFPGGILGFALAGALACGALTEWFGIHAIFGCFLFGVALGDSRHLRERVRSTIDQFVSSIFAPIFFAGIGLRVDFAANFDAVLVALVLLLATAGKLAGCWPAARWSGFSPREGLAVALGLNARGAMEIILGLIALEAGIIGDRLFVALVVMALVTSLTSGSLMQLVLGRAPGWEGWGGRKRLHFTRFLTPRAFIPSLRATTREDAIRELAAAAFPAPLSPAPSAPAAPASPDTPNPDSAAAAVIARERLIPTALGNGVAVPHARVRGLKSPLLALGLSQHGIDFHAPDDRPAKVIILILTPAPPLTPPTPSSVPDGPRAAPRTTPPAADPSTQLDLLAGIARAFADPKTAEQAAHTTTLTEFRALLNEPRA